MKIDHNYIYSNNLDLYETTIRCSCRSSRMPIGTGIVWPGMNDGEFSNNWIFDNWQPRHAPRGDSGRGRGHRRRQRGLPDPLPQHHRPGGARRPLLDVVRQPLLREQDGRRCPTGFGPTPPWTNSATRPAFWTRTCPTSCPTASTTAGMSSRPTDNNCWYQNTGPDGTAASLTAEPPLQTRSARIRRSRDCSAGESRTSTSAAPHMAPRAAPAGLLGGRVAGTRDDRRPCYLVRHAGASRHPPGQPPSRPSARPT